jgi:DNA mismatch endonuclease (patch repair protein)
MDTLSPAERSERMSRIRSKDTRPELIVRRLLHFLNFRYRLHKRMLPGMPDIVFAKRKKAIFVHGCFWHQHPGCKISHIPKSSPEFWTSKLEGNCERDKVNRRRLKALGWNVLVVWECQVGDIGRLATRLQRFLD